MHKVISISKYNLLDAPDFYLVIFCLDDVNVLNKGDILIKGGEKIISKRYWTNFTTQDFNYLQELNRDVIKGISMFDLGSFLVMAIPIFFKNFY